MHLHPQSALSKAAPQFVVYTQILRTDKRPYLAGKTLTCLGSPVIAWCCPKRGQSKCTCTRSLLSQRLPHNSWCTPRSYGQTSSHILQVREERLLPSHMRSPFPLDACSGIQVACLLPERLYSSQQCMIGN